MANKIPIVSLREKIKESLEVICAKSGSADADELVQALDYLDSVKNDPSLSAHLAHQLERRSYGKALDTCRDG